MHSTLILLSYFQVTVTVFLAILPSTSATLSPSRTYHSPKEFNFRDATVQQRGELPSGWSSSGCYTTNSSAPTLTSGGYTDSTGMTVEFCVQICHNLDHIFAGVENGTDCYCGNVLTHGAALAANSDCSTNCVGDSSEKCGGSSGYLNLYWNGQPPPPQPTLVYSVSDAKSWEVAGCFNDSNNARALSVQVSVRGGQYNNTVDNCIDACIDRNYRAAGVEFAQECWCGNSIDNGAMAMSMSYCQLACSGDSTEYCGGANAFLLYYLDGN